MALVFVWCVFCVEPGVLGMHDLRTRRSGSKVFIQLHLELPKEAEPLFGEVAESRLSSLARSLEAEVTVKLRKP